MQRVGCQEKEQPLQMQSGLFGIQELLPCGAHEDYLQRVVSPVASRADSRAGSAFKGTRGARLEEFGGPAPARALLASLSDPELRHLLQRWHVKHPSGCPIGSVNRSEMIGLVLGHSGALAETLRVPLPSSRSRAPPPSECPKVEVVHGRGCAAGALRNTIEFRDLWKELNSSKAAPTRLSANRMSAARLETSPTKTVHPAGLEKSSSHNKASSAGRRREGGSKSVDPALASSKRRLRMLEKEFHGCKSEREQLQIELARRGLLALSMDSNMCQAVFRGQNESMQAVARNRSSTDGFHFDGLDKMVSGLRVDDYLRKVQHTVSPSAMALI